MNKKIKKIILSSSIVGTLVTGLYATETVFTSKNQVVHAAIPKWIKTLAFKAIGKGSNKIYNINASMTTGKYGETVTPGTIAFNGSKYGAEVSFNVNAISTKHSLALYATTDPLNWGSKISVILRNPSGTRVINTSVTSGQYKGITFTKTGNYEASFVSNSNKKWAPYISYRYDKANGNYGTKSILEDNLSNDTDANPYEEVDGYGKILTPVWDGKAPIIEDKQKSLDINQLLNQLKDDIGMYVYSLRDYKENETINFSDTIKDIVYDEDFNETTFTFDTENPEENSLKFNGDLTNVYYKNNTLSLKFNVEKLADNSDTFEVPNYFKYLIDNENKAPKIENYIAVN